MDIAVRLSFSIGFGSLALQLRSSKWSRQLNSSTNFPVRSPFESFNSRRLGLQAAKGSDADFTKHRGDGGRVFQFDERMGTLPRKSEAQVPAEFLGSDEELRRRRFAARRARKAEASAREIEAKLNLTTRKKNFAEKELAKLDRQMKLADAPLVTEQISDEERYTFMKLGLRMRAKLLLGRRGVFDGVVENMHLHWKHRELVKLIFKGPMSEVENTARILEVESGGILVGTVETSKGHAIIYHRGKNYQRPSELRPRHLLSKRQAMKRSLEMQRKHSLEQHILRLEKEIGKLQVGVDGVQYDARVLDNEGNSLAPLDPWGEDLEDSDGAKFNLDADYDEDVANNIKHPFSESGELYPRGVKLDPIFRAQPLPRKERILLRQEALKRCNPLHINVGRSNVVAGLAKSVRIYFQKHPFAVVGVKGRAEGTPVAEIIERIEEATGAVFVSREPNKLVFYRGWPAGEERPDMVTEKVEEEEVPPELIAAIVREEVQDPMDFSYLTREECAIVGLEYKGNGNEDWAESGKDDRAEIAVETLNKERWFIKEEDEVETAIGIDMWSGEKWHTDNDDERQASVPEVKVGGRKSLGFGL